MIRTQVQLPNELYDKAKRFSREREMSLAEVVRRGLELLFDRYPAEPLSEEPWVLPTFDGGATLVPLEDLKQFAYDDETFRSMPWLRKYE
jgi:hypothetical protein